ncbi:hypothetical protein LWI28_008855 [Acer negundo]|uniref:Fe2OG dioxygenase domain-containing protein n=1 Tax=Acer negundo TaxID=4023 RepID=A0AAD5JPP7_ACENE|nr:hypothetical protein LWI28_008855 [Acer negundo]
METKAISFGRTVAVPNVQEFAKNPLTSVPPRYVHPDQDPPIISLNSSSPQVPIIDMQRLLSQDFMDSELQKLDQACREWGFFQLINHEVSSRLVEKVKLESEEFFKLPIEEKNKCRQKEGDLEGYGNVSVMSEDQKLHWGDRLYITTSPPHLRKPHLIPNLPHSFRETLEAYSAELKNVEPTNLGGSLPVPYVQELAKEPLTSVPTRYVRPDQDPPFISSTTSSPEVPVIDLFRLLSGDYMKSELEKFHYACQEWGFFQLINHGVSNSLVEKVKVEIQEFFKLPMEEKNKYWQQAGELEGYGQAFVVSEEQKLDWADMFYLITFPAHFRKPHLFPKLPLPLRDTLEAYSTELRNLAMKILNLIAKALRMEPNDMKDLFEEGMQSMRMNYYPPCPQPELVIGLNPHSDSVGLTILLQLNEMEGLQIRKDGMWIPVKPLPDAFIINIGDILEIVTNGIYRSIEHRATELAKEPLTTVPLRYVRPDQDPPFISNTTSSPQVPVIDLIRLLSGDSMESELEKFHYACQKWGFFQLINHGVSTSLVEKVKAEIQEFFKLPMEEKKKYCQQAGELEGYGQAFVVSEEQKLDWADLFHFITLPTHLRKPHLLPNLPLPLRFDFYSLLNQNLFKTLMIFVKMRMSRNSFLSSEK